ncbi:hypothetical protein BDK51DRAFT_28649 [Blyttiomyces helicus]|uniref:Uncharacterized protein n=1 Tax=Blyttiomyces helicus TaxID=388810 RepID=A0A4P9WR27_9FUNG|nr:hypothetical protein BDK51DRAFT_28649 [Blyttiomyces helicus]|eukprot:RKO93336.1 hypothetical protein BDK51DRAFT_28649 [Blyttiomyces helicus]
MSMDQSWLCCWSGCTEKHLKRKKGALNLRQLEVGAETRIYAEPRYPVILRAMRELHLIWQENQNSQTRRMGPGIGITSSSFIDIVGSTSYALGPIYPICQQADLTVISGGNGDPQQSDSHDQCPCTLIPSNVRGSDLPKRPTFKLWKGTSAYGGFLKTGFGARSQKPIPFPGIWSREGVQSQVPQSQEQESSKYIRQILDPTPLKPNSSHLGPEIISYSKASFWKNDSSLSKDKVQDKVPPPTHYLIDFKNIPQGQSEHLKPGDGLFLQRRRVIWLTLDSLWLTACQR